MLACSRSGLFYISGFVFCSPRQIVWKFFKNQRGDRLNFWLFIKKGVAPVLLKVLAVLLDTTIRRSAVDWKDLKPYWKSEKRLHFSRWPTILLFTSFSKTLLTTKKKTNRAVVVSSRPFPNILRYRDHWWNLPTIWKTRFLKTLIEEFS